MGVKTMIKILSIKSAIAGLFFIVSSNVLAYSVHCYDNQDGTVVLVDKSSDNKLINKRFTYGDCRFFSDLESRA